jgi:hypothetical protein
MVDSTLHPWLLFCQIVLIKGWKGTNFYKIRLIAMSL